jgi:uncharacterized protein YbjT (DUF2867 family)
MEYLSDMVTKVPEGTSTTKVDESRSAEAVQVLTNNDDSRHNGMAYDITGPEAISYEYAARILSEQVGKKYLM